MNALRQFLTRHAALSVVLLIAAVYLPFINEMMLRTTGDEKTYIAQALEMQQQGYWFVQSWAGENDYYKGPLHLMLLRVGYMLFGHEQMFATLYMNFFGLIVVTLMLQKMYRKAFAEQEGWDLLYAGGFSVSIGLYAHMFASQMEAELILFYAAVLYLMHEIKEHKESWTRHLLLWSLIGLAGWLKSPLHSVLLGLSVMMFWGLQGQLRYWFAQKIFWLTLIVGVVVGVMGYLPIYLLDGETWWNNYIVKESLSKQANGVPITDSIFPVLTYYLAPLMFPALLSFVLGLSTLFHKKLPLLDPRQKTMIQMGLALTAPTMLFFIVHPYRGEIYVLPAVSGTWLIAVVLWQAYCQKMRTAYRVSIALSALVLALLPAALLYLETAVLEMPLWWPKSIMMLSILALITLLYLAFFESGAYETKRPSLLVFGFVPLFWLLGTVLHVLGDYEMQDVRDYVAEHHITEPLGYYNLQRNVWSEYGSLTFWLPHPVTGLHDEEQLMAWIDAGGVVLVPGEAYLQKTQSIVHKSAPQISLEVTPWRRWLTHGKAEHSEETRFHSYLETGDLSRVQFLFYIVKKSSY